MPQGSQMPPQTQMPQGSQMPQQQPQQQPQQRPGIPDMPNVQSQGNAPKPDPMMQLVCAKDQDEYCILKQTTPIETIPASTMDEIGAITEAQLTKVCNMNGSDKCSKHIARIEQEMQAEKQMQQVASGASKKLPNLPTEVLCQRNENRGFCLPIVKAAIDKNFMNCLSTAIGINPTTGAQQQPACSATCEATFKTALEQMGCCMKQADTLLSYALMAASIGNRRQQQQEKKNDGAGLLAALGICSGLRGIHMAVQQDCGGVSKSGGATSPVFTAQLNVPCKLLELNEAQLKSSVQADIAQAAGVNLESIINLRLSCNAATTVQLVAPTTAPAARRMTPYRMFRELAASSLQGTQATFSVQAGENTADTVATIQSAISKPASLQWSNTQAIVSSKCPDCPVVTMTSGTAQEQKAQSVNANARCDPLKLMEVTTQCTSQMNNWDTLTDAQAATRMEELCAPTAACSKALNKLGDGINYCEFERSDIRVFLQTMCVKSNDNKYCGQYLRSSDVDRSCGKRVGQTSCAADATCEYMDGKCGEKPTQATLAGFCGKCASSYSRAAATDKVDTTMMEMMCVKAGNTYCMPVAMSTNMKDMTAATFCGNTEVGRCGKLYAQTIATAAVRRAERAAEKCNGAGCSQIMATAKAEARSAEYRLTNGCKKAEDGEYCADKMAAVGSNAVVQACVTAIEVTNACPSNCSKVMTDLMANWGCCVSVIQQGLELDEKPVADTITSAPAPGSATTAPSQKVGLLSIQPCVPNIGTMVTTQTCAKPPQKIHKKRLGLKMSCSDLSEAVKATLRKKIPADISAAIGVAVEAVTDVEPKCDSSITVTTADAPSPATTTAAAPATTAPARREHRRMRTLATSSGVAVDYTLKSTNDADTERASAEMDRKVQSDEFVMPQTQSSVQEVCQTCGDIAVDKQSSKTLSIEDESAGSLLRVTLLNIVLPIAIAFLFL